MLNLRMREGQHSGLKAPTGGLSGLIELHLHQERLVCFARKKKLRFHPRQLYPAAKQGETQRVLLMLSKRLRSNVGHPLLTEATAIMVNWPVSHFFTFLSNNKHFPDLEEKMQFSCMLSEVKPEKTAVIFLLASFTCCVVRC